MDIRLECRALLFDMDGVILDSTAAVARVWRRWAEERGFDPERVVRMAHGRPSLATLRDLLPKADLAAENHIIEEREIEDQRGVAAFPGARELLAQLPAARWTLVTSSTPRLAKARLAAAGVALPGFMVTSGDVPHGKPHPEPYRKGAGLLNVAPADCLVVEDAPPGIIAGRGAGCRVLALRSTMPDDVLLAAGPDWITDNCGELKLAEVTRDGLRCMIQNATPVTPLSSAVVR